MTTHELAKELLKMPDVDLFIKDKKTQRAHIKLNLSKCVVARQRRGYIP